jgi:hypothetical protein
MKLLSAMDPEAAASAHNNHPGPLPRRSQTLTKEKRHATNTRRLSKTMPQEVSDIDATIARSK